MIKLPFEIIRLLWNCGNNRIEHLDGFAKEFCNATFDIVSTSPFVIQANNTNILLTRDENDPSIENYQYAVLTNKKPRKSDIIKGNIISIRWLKHPNFKNLQPNEIVASWRGKFLYKKENIQESILGLRAPQLGAIYAFMSKAQIHHGRNIIVMPTGTGKTETMLSILIANQCPKVLITVPSDALRDQISNKFLTLGILPEFGIVASDCNYPIVGVVKEGMDYNGWYTLIEKSNVIITTMPLITNCESAIIDLFKEKISHLFVDEAHHSEAKTWSEFIDSFNDEKVTLFTATPFRNDNRRLRGEFIYNFSLKEAQSQGYYKPIKFIPIREYDLAKADKCIAEVAVNQLRSDLENEYDHILMARCSTKQRAKEIMEVYQQYPDLNPVMVFSSMPNQKAILKDIKEKKHKIIVCVNMLGEGFDMPELKIAAIHDAKQSLPITLQFIGRFTRTSYDSNLGNASFITNIAYPPILEELEELYAKDADWNSLLPLLNDGTTQQEKDFNQFIQYSKTFYKDNINKEHITSEQLASCLIRELTPLTTGTCVLKVLNETPSDTTIHIDLVLFLRALTNLVNNAMSYSQSMMPRIVIKLSSEQNKIVLSVWNDGSRFSANMIDNVGSLFYQDNQSGKDSQNHHFGIGLSFVKRVVELHDWELKLSNENNGAMVTIYI